MEEKEEALSLLDLKGKFESHEEDFRKKVSYTLNEETSLKISKIAEWENKSEDKILSLAIEELYSQYGTSDFMKERIQPPLDKRENLF